MDIKELFSKPYWLLRHNTMLFLPLWLLAVILIVETPESVKVANNHFIFLLLAIGGLFCVFLAGWFNMFHKIATSVDNIPKSNEDKFHYESISINEFFTGVGQYFFKVVLGIILYLILIFLVLNIAGAIGAKYLGYPHTFTHAELVKASANEHTMTKFVQSISKHDITLIYKWIYLLFGSLSFLSYLTMFWLQSLIANKKNPILAYVESLKTILHDPIMTFIMFFLYVVGLAVAAILYMIGTFSFIGQVTAFLAQTAGMLIFTFVVIYFTMMLFVYFEKYRKNTGNPGSDSFGKN